MRSKLSRKAMSALEALGVAFITIMAILIIILAVAIITDWKFQKSEPGPFNQSIQTEYQPTERISCTYYDISEEFEKAFGTANIDRLESSCVEIGGEWTDDDREFSCFWNPAYYTMPCTHPNIKVFEQFCEDQLKATYVCDNTIAYSGCICNRDVPDEWEEKCWWQKIDEYTGLIPGMTRMEWKNNLVPGDYKFTWELSNPNDVDIMNEGTVTASYDDSTAGEHEFTVSDLPGWGIALTNYAVIETQADIKLYQLVCESDDLDWDPHMFDEPASIEEQIQEELK